MTVVQKIGFFCEMPVRDRIATLQSICRETPRIDEEKIISYLESGAEFAAVPGVEEDALTDPPLVIGPMHVRTDGVWAWPQTLAYYIRRYHIALPEAFLTHMRKTGWRCPADIDVSQCVLEGDVPMG